ncbi:hypothetical protein LTR70_006757 [Exophiala xenobiotica]|uniref:2EXR domain-containing protein n=1 Tax=Lithohypha guttulata TaxID=1690604 RepID=A0ABR0KAT6_9EURO|nr:hypothetical protein LTR24_005023 [Lithohypha guttulata]KAK5315418.1 hypothetical protein LTR70_006757 [Exophiala xenobiotica]
MSSKPQHQRGDDVLANQVGVIALGATPPMGLLDLPSEIRLQIFDYAVPVCRLAPFPYLDVDWSMKTQEYRGIPGMLFVCRKIYEELVPILYSRAVLEVAPAQQGYMWFNVEHSKTKRTTLYAYTLVTNTFRIYRSEHLKLIRKAHIFSNQPGVIDGSCYESLLQWLIERTGVEHIRLSSRPLTRIRGSASFDLFHWRAVFHDNPPRREMRIIRIFSKAERPPWEHEKMMRLRCKARDGTLGPMQIYFWSSSDEAGPTLQLDPRWLTKLNDDPEKIEMLEEGAPLIDELMSRVLDRPQLQAYKDNARYFEGQYWVYQMILVA